MRVLTIEQYRAMKARSDIGAKWLLMGFKEEYPSLCADYEAIEQRTAGKGEKDDAKRVGT